MSSFGEAFKKGLDAHTRATAARAEMDAVLADASREIAAVVGVPVSLRFEIRERPTREPSIYENVTGVRAPRENFTGLVASLDRVASALLAEATFGELGYPVNLRWEDQWVSAQDQASFEAAVKSLLEHPAGAERITKLAHRPTKPAA